MNRTSLSKIEQLTNICPLDDNLDVLFSFVILKFTIFTWVTIWNSPFLLQYLTHLLGLSCQVFVGTHLMI